MGWLARQSKLSKFVIGMIMLVGAVASIYAGLGGPPPGKWFSGSNGPGNSVLAEPDISTPHSNSDRSSNSGNSAPCLLGGHADCAR